MGHFPGGMAETRILHAELEESAATHSIRHFIRLFTTVMKIVKPFVTESVQVSGLESLLDGEGEQRDGPFLWLPKHESWNDIVNIPSLWYDFGKPIVKAPLRRNILKVKVPSKILAGILSPITFEVYRTWTKEGESEGEREQMRLANRERLAVVREHYYKGRQAMVFPEGTSKSDGRFSSIRAGAYNLSKIERDDGGLDLLQCVPIGNTYDFMAGDTHFGKKRHLVFLNIGEVFLYEPPAREEGETNKAYVKRDIAHFGQRILDYLIDLNTYTTSQLAGEYFMGLAKEGINSVTEEKLDAIVGERVSALQGIEGLIFDEALLKEDSRKLRVEHFYEELLSQGYINESGTIDRDRVLLAPQKKDYKKGNILLYSVNRLYGIAEARPAVAKVLENVR